MNSVGKIDHLHAKESNWTVFSLHIKINSKWIKDLNETPKKIKLLENWRQYSQQYSLKHQSLQDLFWNLPYEQFYFQTPCPVPLRCVSDLYQYHIVLISMGVQCSLKSRSVIPPSIFFLDIALATQGLLCLQTNFKTLCSSSVKNPYGNTMVIALNSQVALGSIVILAILILPIKEYGIFFYLFAISIIF